VRPEKLMDFIGQIDDDFITEADCDFIKEDSPDFKAEVRQTKAKPSGHTWIKRATAAAACLIIAAMFLHGRIQQNVPDDVPDTVQPKDPDGVPDLVQPTDPGNPSDQVRPTDPDNPPGLPDLPKLPVNTYLGTFGFEGYLAYDISELQNGNPWTENNDLTSMPVFANPHEYNGAGAPVNGMSAEELLAEAEKIAGLFDLEILSLYTEPEQGEIERKIWQMEADGWSAEQIRDNIESYTAIAECSGAQIRIEGDGHIILTLTPDTFHLGKEIGKLGDYENFTISFLHFYKTADGSMHNAGLPLPDGYSFAYVNASYKQVMDVMRYLMAEYGGFMEIKEPGYDLAADYTFSGDLHRLETSVFENAGSLADRILSYNFRRLYFLPTGLNMLGAIKYYNADLSQKIGDYPIITAEEARRLLLEGHYITSVPDALPGEEYIARVELIYRTGRLDTVFMPYYRFLVELPAEALENGLKTFGAFYVPAVRSEYLENMPVWDGRFN